MPAGLIALALGLGGCGGGATDSIAGTYDCGPSEAPAADRIEVRADGTVSITQGGEVSEGTWSLEDDRGNFTFAGQAESVYGRPFTVEDDRLVFDDVFVCTPTS